jgi:hypothetical protein
MRIVFDQGTPEPLRRALNGHSVATAFESTSWPEIRQHEAEIVAAVAALQPGEYRELRW